MKNKVILSKDFAKNLEIYSGNKKSLALFVQLFKRKGKSDYKNFN